VILPSAGVEFLVVNVNMLVGVVVVHYGIKSLEELSTTVMMNFLSTHNLKITKSFLK
jgi:hypothetical protein